MKQLKEYISEALVSEALITHRITMLIRKHTPKTVQPKTGGELEEIIYDTIDKEGNDCDLNFIDTSLITDMSWLFSGKKNTFNGDISEWDVSNVTDMSNMFAYSDFNGDISEWDVSNVTDMGFMFSHSKFNGDISKWDVSSVVNMQNMFQNSIFKGDISEWDVSNVKYMLYMFDESRFKGDISKWHMPKLKIFTGIFKSCPLENVYTGKIDKARRFEKL